MKNVVPILFFSVTLFNATAQIHSTGPSSVFDIAAIEQKAHEKKIRSSDRTAAANTYDLNYHRCVWAIDPAVNYINGNITSYFKPIVTSFNTMQFDLSNMLIVDSVKYHNTSLLYTQLPTNLLEITFPIVLSVNVIDSVTIYYQGVPSNSGFGSFVKSTHAGIPIIWTLSEPFGAQDWWPCKQDLNDKIDSIDIVVTTPQAYRVASNGLLVSETVMGTDKIYHWKSRYKIATYLIAIAVTNYAVYSDSVFLSTDTIPVLNYVYPENLANAKTETPEIKKIIKLYDSLTILYPFAKEKYGHAQFSWGGGMEHQTMSFMSSFNFGLTAHECAHQWFGDHITCGSWEDIWLNEGFATYFQGLTEERYFPNNWNNWKKEKVDNITSAPDGSVLCDDTTSVARIFNGRLTYNKGSYLLHMLRWKLGDAVFFQALKNYLNDPALAGGYAQTSKLKAHLEATSGKNLANFFDQWYYNQGYPSYEIIYNQTGNNVVLTVNQTQSHTSVSFFEMPIPIKFVGVGEDTTIVFNHQYSGQIFTATIPFPIISVVFDPELHLISANNKTKNISTSNDLNNEIKLYPNPATTTLNLSLFLLSKKELRFEIIDIKGRKIISINDSFNIGLTVKPIDISQLSAGTYIIKISGNEISYSEKFVKK